MTKEEAIKIIENYDVNGCGYCHQGGKEIEKAFQMAIKALEDQRWIPVSVQLPKDCEDVFVTIKLQDAGREPEYHVDVGSYSRCWQTDQQGRSIEAGGIWSYCIDWYEGQDVCEVIAWMPIPKPYKEGES